MAFVVIQHGEQEEFLRPDQTWTRCIHEAERFCDVREAMEACEGRRLRHVRLVAHLFGKSMAIKKESVP